MNQAPPPGPHQRQPLLMAGKPLAEAQGVLILLHGRGATAVAILELAQHLHHPDLAYLAPQAAGNSWYPYSFLAPLANNEPGLSSGLRAVAAAVAQAQDASIPAGRILIGGFSQGACLAAEFVARQQRPLGGLLVFSGGLIGPPGTPRTYAGRLDGMPIFLGCSQVDLHIPKERVEESTAVFSQMGAIVRQKLYPNMDHTIIPDEIEAALALIQRVMPT